MKLSTSEVKVVIDVSINMFAWFDRAMTIQCATSDDYCEYVSVCMNEMIEILQK